MKTREFVIPGFEFPVLVHHREDWSGTVVIEWTDAHAQRHHHVEIPAAILLHLSFKQVREMVLSELDATLDQLMKQKGGSEK